MTASTQIFPDIALQMTSGLGGFMEFYQNAPQDVLTVVVSLYGLTPNTVHGWHVHEMAITNQNCSTAGAHYNPFNMTHGAPTSPIRHVGDFGNFITDMQGNANYTYVDTVASLFGQYTILNRTVVIHEMQDNLGLAGNATSLATGDAGAKTGCAIIVKQCDRCMVNQYTQANAGMHSMPNHYLVAGMMTLLALVQL